MGNPLAEKRLNQCNEIILIDFAFLNVSRKILNLIIYIKVTI